MVNKLRSVVKKTKGRQAPIPVKIVSDVATMPDKPRGHDKWEAQEALRTLQRASEIQSNKPLMKAAKAEAKSMMKQLSSVCK